MQLGLFPLPLFLLPGGITKLRIFEPRYVRLVKESMAEQKGFVLAMKEGDAICTYGTHVQIIDFETLPDGLLGITIKGLSRVKLSHIDKENDGLWVGHTEALPDWPPSNADTGLLGEALKALFKTHPEHASQYEEVLCFNDVNWVCQRWLEVLPLANNQRQWFIAQHDAEDAMQFITVLLTEETQREY
ncbi:ATP-dependent protease [Enterovibrio norvegicus]|uniref:Lon N-terminal domain-containing protein n=2 Tax=Enterovibrio norvegicus TaxID=188144 RepID=A0A1I5JZF0_9GAMM|nr:LON peptidase substrate-binding domain-containing protein [Enterovibrio norvegicus]MCC4797247.1 LON peptidase substrate-binding domain-containing protein [Enterovibrio norvegicus]OEE68673.1 ATP-dependent protease [Enterovibrio norvegicus]OEF58308.1 ATP-dependent protease [Enterovibrio norvegicus]PMH72458.1 ATP-dependent protease [Enterovibrio norvegicus]PMI26975.1 ATP-dependent protease [Enterovibrio norvegicus]